MDTFEVIAERRSIRKFKESPVPRDLIDRVLHAATLAPSGKNDQPWRFIVVREDKRAEMIQVMNEGIAAVRADGIQTGSSEWTARIMEQAPVTVFVFNANMENEKHEWTIADRFMNVVDIQSIGAAIQNMLLMAHDIGLGSLWICDVFYAYPQLCDWLGETHQMVAAVSLGYPDENPGARPRKVPEEVTRWL